MLKKYDEAVTLLTLALTVNPDDFESKRNLRLVQKEMACERETLLSRQSSYLVRRIAAVWRTLKDRL